MAHQRPLCGPRDDSRVSLALMPFRPFGGLRRPPAGRFAKKPRLEAFCVILFELFGGGNGVCKSYNFILRPQIACKSGFPNGQKYSRRRQNDTPYSPLPGRFGGGYTSAAFNMRRSSVPAHGPVPVMPHGPRRGVAAADTGNIPSFRSGFGQVIADLWFLKSPNNYVYNYLKMAGHADFRPCRSFSCSKNIH